MRSLADLDKVLAKPHLGLCDTALALVWNQVVERCPQAKLMTLRRPLDEALASLERIGCGGLEARRSLARLDCALGELEHLPGVRRTSYAELGTAQGARRAFEFCLPVPWDPSWYRFMLPIRAEVIPAVMQAKVRANAVGLRRIYGEALAYYDSKVAQ